MKISLLFGVFNLSLGAAVNINTGRVNSNLLKCSEKQINTTSSYSPYGKFIFNQKYDCGEIRKDGIIGRYAFFKPYYIEEKGIGPCARYTEFILPGAFEDITLSFEYIATNSISMSFTETIAYQASNVINLTAEIPGFIKATAEDTFKKTNEFSKTAAFAYTRQNSISTSFAVSKEAGNNQNKKFAVGKIGNVYELKMLYYETHWLFWNHEEVQQDSLKELSAFISTDTYMTVIYEDGTYF